MVWIAVYFSRKCSHNPKLSVVATNMDVEFVHIVRGTSPPILRVIRHIVGVWDDRGLPVLRTRRSIEVETIQPHTRTVEHLPSVSFVLRFSRTRVMQIQVDSKPKCRCVNNTKTVTL